MKFIVHRFLSAILLIAAAGSCQASLVAAEYYVGSDPGEGHATAVAFTSDDGLSRELENAVIALNRAPGTYEVGLRVKDDAGRWSNPSIRRFTLVAGDFALAGGIDPNAPDAGAGTGTSSPKLVEPLSQAEYYVGTDPGAGNGSAMTFATDDELSRDLESAVIALNMPAGTYDVGLRVKDASGRWSNAAIRRFTLVAGDFTLAGGIDPNAPDAGTGTSTPKLVEPLSQAEYYVGIDPGVGNGTAMTFASDDELSRDLESAVIALNMPAGTYDVGLRVKDASGRWSNAAIRRFTLVAGDFTLAVGIDPNAPDGGSGASTPKLVEPLSQAEYYVGTDPGVGNGTAMTFVSDDELSRDLESAVIALDMPAGTYDVGLRVKDASGRWSNAAIRRFTLVAGGFTLAGGIDPNAPDAGTGTSSPKLVEPLSQAEYYVGTDPGTGNGTAMTFASDDELSRDLESAVIALDMPAGTYDVGLRVKDASGRWSNAAIRRFTLVAGGFTLAGGIDPNAPDGGSGASSPKLVEPLSQAEYYVGTDPGVGNGTAMTFASDDELSRDLESAVIALNMPAGTYDVGLRVKDASGRWSNAAIRRFTLVAGDFTLAGGIDSNAPDGGSGASTPKLVEPLSQAEYYVGTDPGAGNGTALNFTSDDELSRELESAVIALNMDSGTYDVGLRVKDSANRWSNVAIRRFTMVAFPPSIIDQPVNVTATEDGSASFSVTCTSPSAHYQWQKDGVDLAGATEATLVLSPVQAASAGIYTVLVSNSAGSELSSGATLTVNRHPVISEPPASLATTEGETATFSVTASNPYAGALSYQWQKNGVDLAGATLATLVLDPVQLADAGDYSVVVSNSVASLTSLAATLTVTPASHDSDGDGLDDSVETNTGVYVSLTNTGTNPNLADSDGDGVPDGLEVKEKTSPVDATKFNSFSKGMVAYYPLDGTTHDESGQGHNATLTGLSSYVPNHLGKDNSALKFSDTEQHAVGEGLNLSGSSMSIACWYKKSFDPIDSWIFRLGSESASGKSVHVALDYPNDIRFSFFYNDFDYQSSPIQSIDRWYNLVVTYDSSSHKRKIFVNGIQVASGFAPEAFTGNGDFGFGCNGVIMDELRVFDRALSSIEVTSLYQSEVPKMPRFELVNGSYTWQEAKADAESRGGRLAVLDTQAKIDEANQFLTSSGTQADFFIGLTDFGDEGHWRWITEEPLSAANWNTPTNEPNNGLGNGSEDGAQVKWSWNWAWNDCPLATFTSGYLLEMPDDSVWAPQITIPPVNVTVDQGGSATLSVSATGTTLQYQWRKDSLDIAGAMQSTLTLNPAEKSDSARYTVVVFNAAGSVTSGEALVMVLIPPAIEVQPVGADAYLGDSVTLAVVATGSGLNYQWQKNGGNLEGATAATLVLGSVQASDAASYTVVISNALGSVTSSAAIVTAVADVRDSDGDGLTNYDEVFVYGTSPNSADTDGDGLSDPYELGLGRYSVVLGSFTWQQAEADAVAKGGTLATFASQGEWLWAQESIGADALYDVTGLWIGATDSAVEGTWQWITGEAVTYSHWAVGEPNNGNNSDYAAIAGDLGGETGDWYDYRATTQRDGYILETGYATDPTVADADHDGLSDGEEQTAGTNPFLADTDGDGLSDGIEVKQTHTNPQLADSNGNGIADLLEDTDGDGLSNQEEFALGTNLGMTDSDSDGLLDLEELGRNRFSLVQGAFTYATATANAAALGGHLATFTDAAELAEVMREIGSTALDNLSGSWIGATDVAVEGEWRWVTGEALAFSPWAVGKPNNIYNADYAAMVGGKNGGVVGKWADFSATALLDSYLLEKGFVTNPAVADTDGDGANDGEETEWGSNPEDVSKLPEWKVTIDRIHSSSDGIRLRFPTLVGASYRVEVSADLNTWQALTVDILGDGNLKTHEVIRGGATQQFFRVKQN